MGDGIHDASEAVGLDGVTDAIGDGVSGVADGVAGGVNGVASGVASGVSGVADGVSGGLDGAGDAVADGVNGVANGVADGAAAAEKATEDGINDAANAITHIADQPGGGGGPSNSTGNMIEDAVQTAANVVSNVATGTVTVVGGVVEGTGEVLTNVAKGTGEVLSDVAEGTGEVLSDVAEGTGAVVSNVAGGTVDLLTNTEEAVEDAFKHAHLPDFSDESGESGESDDSDDSGDSGDYVDHAANYDASTYVTNPADLTDHNIYLDKDGKEIGECDDANWVDDKSLYIMPSNDTSVPYGETALPKWKAQPGGGEDLSAKRLCEKVEYDDYIKCQTNDRFYCFLHTDGDNVSRCYSKVGDEVKPATKCEMDIRLNMLHGFYAEAYNQAYERV